MSGDRQTITVTPWSGRHACVPAPRELFTTDLPAQRRAFVRQAGRIIPRRTCPRPGTSPRVALGGRRRPPIPDG